jgi:hypothetical protein
LAVDIGGSQWDLLGGQFLRKNQGQPKGDEGKTTQHLQTMDWHKEPWQRIATLKDLEKAVS